MSVAAAIIPYSTRNVARYKELADAIRNAGQRVKQDGDTTEVVEPIVFQHDRIDRQTLSVTSTILPGSRVHATPQKGDVISLYHEQHCEDVQHQRNKPDVVRPYTHFTHEKLQVKGLGTHLPWSASIPLKLVRKLRTEHHTANGGLIARCKDKMEEREYRAKDVFNLQDGGLLVCQGFGEETNFDGKEGQRPNPYENNNSPWRNSGGSGGGEGASVLARCMFAAASHQPWLMFPK